MTPIVDYDPVTQLPRTTEGLTRTDLIRAEALKLALIYQTNYQEATKQKMTSSDVSKIAEKFFRFLIEEAEESE